MIESAAGPRQTLLPIFPKARSPLVVAYGLGVDSTAMLAGYAARGIRPDLILFSDVGAERKATYAYLPVINSWLREMGWPEVTVVQYQAKNFKHFPPYFNLLENILTNVSLPAIAYGGHSCSAKWKIAPQDRFLENWAPAQEAWAAGLHVERAVGFEDSPHEHRRATRCSTFAVQDLDAGRYRAVYPLQTWGWDRNRCVEEIRAAGLPVPSKSSCFFCTAMKPWEVQELRRSEHMRIVIIEARTARRHLDYAESKGWPLGDGVPLTEGLWRRRVKGLRGATPKPGSMTEFIRQEGLLPAALIDSLIALTPTHPFSKEDFDREGLTGWRDWIERICGEAEALAVAGSDLLPFPSLQPAALVA